MKHNTLTATILALLMSACTFTPPTTPVILVRAGDEVVFSDMPYLAPGLSERLAKKDGKRFCLAFVRLPRADDGVTNATMHWANGGVTKGELSFSHSLAQEPRGKKLTVKVMVIEAHNDGDGTWTDKDVPIRLVVGKETFRCELLSGEDFLQRYRDAFKL